MRLEEMIDEQEHYAMKDKIFVRLSALGGQMPMHFSMAICTQRALYDNELTGCGKDHATKKGGALQFDTWFFVCCNLDKAVVMDRAADMRLQVPVTGLLGPLSRASLRY